MVKALTEESRQAEAAREARAGVRRIARWRGLKLSPGRNRLKFPPELLG